MSALFPNVPDVPGVPVVNRAPATLQTAIGGATRARLFAQEGLDRLAQSDMAAASAAFGSSSGAAQGALVMIEPIFSDSSIPYGTLYGAAGSATGAVNAIASGNIIGAITAGQDAVNYATDAIASLQAVLNPPGQPVLADSGPEVQADVVRQWGLYRQDGTVATTVDNVASLEVLLEAQISDYPVENGGFGSYNKVIRPFDIRLALSRGGSVEDRQEFAKAIQDAWQSTELFNVVTPEVVYLDVNVVGVRRLVESDRGVGLMMLDVALRKVRQTARLAFANTEDPASANAVNNGSVQTQSDFRYEGIVD